MRNQRQSPNTDQRPVAAPILAPLSRTSSSGWWLRPAIAVGAVLVVVIALGRLGSTDVRPSPAPTSQATAVAVLPPSPTPSPVTSPGPQVQTPAPVPPFGPAVAERPDGKRYVDGIPTSIGGTPVIRVRDAATLPSGEYVLVGGWYYGPDCRHVFRPGPCPPAMISDEPSGSPRVASLVLDSRAITGTGSGARIFRAVTERDPVCVFAAYSSCLSQLLVIDALWTGDEETVTAPIIAPSLMGALALGFSNVDFPALEEIPAICPIPWPAQTYVGSTASLLYFEPPSPPVRLVLFFGSTAERRAAAPQIRRAAQDLSVISHPTAWCRGIPDGIGQDDHWVALDNVMLLLGSSDATTVSIVEAALSVAQQLSAN